jgi:hypothetical protein
MLLPRPKPFIFCGVDLWGVYYLKFLIHPQTVLQGDFQGSKGMNAIQLSLHNTLRFLYILTFSKKNYLFTIGRTHIPRIPQPCEPALKKFD